jgi:hypothetical protein
MYTITVDGQCHHYCPQNTREACPVARELSRDFPRAVVSLRMFGTPIIIFFRGQPMR